jgi:hypothetical protein
MSIRFLNSIDATTGPSDFSEFDDLRVDNNVSVGGTLTAKYINGTEYDYSNLEVPSVSGIRMALNYLIFSLNHGIMTDNIFAREATLENTSVELVTYSEKSLAVPIIDEVVTLHHCDSTTFKIELNDKISKFVLRHTPADTFTFTLVIKQDGYGGKDVNWVFENSTIKWANNEIPQMSQDAEHEDIYSFTTFSGGGVWYGFVGGQNFV